MIGPLSRSDVAYWVGISGFMYGVRAQCIQSLAPDALGAARADWPRLSKGRDQIGFGAVNVVLGAAGAVGSVHPPVRGERPGCHVEEDARAGHEG